MDWRVTARRLLVSAFLCVHIAATLIWVLPACPIRQRTISAVSCYIMPLGLWQFWTMFAPDPVRDTFTLEAEVIDGQGLRYRFAFPRLAGYTTWQAIPRFRYSKYAANMAVDAFQEPRLFAARHAVRALNLGADRFPMDVHLYYELRSAPPAGEAPAPELTPSRASLISTFHFEKPSEVRP